VATKEETSELPPVTAVQEETVPGSIPIKPLFTKNKKDTRHSVLTIFMTPQVLKPGSPPPAWTQLSEEEHKIIPIMNETSMDK